MPNSDERVEEGVAAAFSGTGLSTMLNSPQAPVKSRFQIAWPGSRGSAGCSTRSTSGRCSSQRATSSAGLLVALEPHRQRAQAAQREIHVVGPDAQSEGRPPSPSASARSPRWPRPCRASGRNGRRYIWCRTGSTGRRRARGPEIERASPRYCPSAPARPCRARPRRSPGCPASRRISEPGASTNTARVFGCISVAMSAPISGS